MDVTKSRALTERQWKKRRQVVQNLRENALISGVREIKRGTFVLEETFNELLPFHKMGWEISSR